MVMVSFRSLLVVLRLSVQQVNAVEEYGVSIWKDYDAGADTDLHNTIDVQDNMRNGEDHYSFERGLRLKVKFDKNKIGKCISGLKWVQFGKPTYEVQSSVKDDSCSPIKPQTKENLKIRTRNFLNSCKKKDHKPVAKSYTNEKINSYEYCELERTYLDRDKNGRNLETGAFDTEDRTLKASKSSKSSKNSQNILVKTTKSEKKSTKSNAAQNIAIQKASHTHAAVSKKSSKVISLKHADVSKKSSKTKDVVKKSSKSKADSKNESETKPIKNTVVLESVNKNEYKHKYKCTSFKLIVCDMKKKTKPLSVPLMCEDEDECVLVPIRDKLISICDWVKLDLSRCNMESNKFQTNETKCKSKPSILSDVCKQTCKMCGTGDIALPTGTPSSAPTTCEDDNECILVPMGNKLRSICEWVSKDLSRCEKESNSFLTRNSKCKHDSKKLGDICRQTCRECGGTPDEETLSPTTGPSTAPTICEDDNECVLIPVSKKTCIHL